MSAIFNNLVAFFKFLWCHIVVLPFSNHQNFSGSFALAVEYHQTLLLAYLRHSPFLTGVYTDRPKASLLFLLFAQRFSTNILPSSG